jgi:signal transduction histidine kinase
LSVSEAEKKRVSIELHDGLGQHLTGVAFVARALSDALARDKHDKMQDAEWLVRLLNEAIGKTRALARGMWPVSLERDSFDQTLRKLAEDLESIFGISCAVQIIDAPPLSSNVAAHHLFRVMQEAATNAIKHGNARRITFRIENVGADVVVSVANDGLAPAAGALNDSQGLGVVGMRLRADAIGGRLDIDAPAEGGCRVVLTLPGFAAPNARTQPHTPDATCHKTFDQGSEQQHEQQQH